MRRLLILLYCLIPLSAFTQSGNLIPNPGFEDHKKCPKGLGEIDRVADWSSPNGGTPDYFHTCAEGRAGGAAGIPNNFFSTQPRWEGQAYAGIYAGQKETEFLQVQLLQPLEAGVRYCLRFRASPPSPTGEQFRALRVWFRDSPLSQQSWERIDDEGQAQAPTYQTAPRTSDWTLMTYSFVAEGGEEYLTIGYFGETGGKAYTYLDDFGLYAYDSPLGCAGQYFSGNATQDEHNYVPNPGFEMKFGCPRFRADMEMCYGWRVSENTPDFFHRCGQFTAAVPDNELGTQEPHAGEAYSGFWCYLLIRDDYREFISMELQRPLERGEIYCLSMWVSLAEVSRYALHDLQMMPARSVESIPSQVPSDDPRLVFLDSGEGVLSDREGWTRINAVFIANGGERVLTIGNFRKNNDPGMVRDTMPGSEMTAFKEACYYYVDDVSLCAIDAPIADCPDHLSPQIVADPDDPTLFLNMPEPDLEVDLAEMDTIPPPADWQVGDTLVLENFLFAFDASELAPEALPLLDTLAAYLGRHLELELAITGHTDDQGSEAYNLKLSRERAEAVVSYVAGLGIKKSRMEAEGAGESQPLVPNDSEENQARNRRVEIRFLEE